MRLRERRASGIKTMFTASVLAAGLMCCGRSEVPGTAPILPKTKSYEVMEGPPKAPPPPGLYTRHEIKVVRKGDHILRHYFPLEKPGVLSLKVDTVGKRGIFLSGDTSIFGKKKRIWVKYGETAELYGSALVLELHARKNGLDSAMVNITFVADKR